MYRLIVILFSLLISVACTPAKQSENGANPAPFETERFSFLHEDIKLVGLIDTPTKGDPRGLVIMVPGSGGTNIISDQWNRELRELLVSHGFRVFAYDKPGNGDSEGVFNSDQPVEDSADEIVAAIEALRTEGLIADDVIGLWGISRAGWIAPLVIAKDPSVDFWISVSGPIHLDNFAYLLETNWRIKGYPEERVQRLRAEYLKGFDIQRSGGTYRDYLEATPNFNDDPLSVQLRGEYTEDRFLSYQKFLSGNPPVIDAETGLMIHVEDYPQLLSSIDVPTLAQFGEGDSQLDWNATRELYQRTLTGDGQLSVVSFPQCNHGIQPCESCAFDDNMSTVLREGFGPACEGFFPSTSAWLEQVGFPKRTDK
ncbi:MAG: alpha/beta hydrolase [Pseudomonadota bacterium]